MNSALLALMALLAATAFFAILAYFVGRSDGYMAGRLKEIEFQKRVREIEGKDSE